MVTEYKRLVPVADRPRIGNSERTPSTIPDGNAHNRKPKRKAPSQSSHAPDPPNKRWQNTSNTTTASSEVRQINKDKLDSIVTGQAGRVDLTRVKSIHAATQEHWLFAKVVAVNDVSGYLRIQYTA